MTVKELKEILDKYPDDMLCVAYLHSDSTDLEEPEVCVMQPRKPGKDYYERYYPNQYDNRLVTTIKVLHF